METKIHILYSEKEGQDRIEKIVLFASHPEHLIRKRGVKEGTQFQAAEKGPTNNRFKKPEARIGRTKRATESHQVKKSWVFVQTYCPTCGNILADREPWFWAKDDQFYVMV
ncbi:hypothetical protein LY76DRAFT_646947 [Colletotrichum caudatum]|nr:hypothetical protein LY76DRAFT_646947 [Colletotrichum caudatum]